MTSTFLPITPGALIGVLGFTMLACGGCANRQPDSRTYYLEEPKTAMVTKKHLNPTTPPTSVEKKGKPAKTSPKKPTAPTKDIHRNDVKLEGEDVKLEGT
jgi:hypothetical protein